MTSDLSQTTVLASWERAVELFNSKLTHDKKKKIDLKDCQKASFEELLKTANEAKDRAESKRYRWTPTVRKIFQQINQYAVAGDTITQYNTEYASIAWGSFRFLLQVRNSITIPHTPFSTNRALGQFTLEEGNTAEKLSETLDSLIQIIFRARQYAELFSTHSGSSTSDVFVTLQDNLTRLYAEVLNVLVRATIFFKKGTLSTAFI
jgi:hypothetical protein